MVKLHIYGMPFFFFFYFKKKKKKKKKKKIVLVIHFYFWHMKVEIKTMVKLFDDKIFI